ncbi:MAG: L,D-transpeptidase family protein [Clostridia bacterium]|nr:L,D-transpeptidase family protein [Clostridia bacterium]
MKKTLFILLCASLVFSAAFSGCAGGGLFAFGDPTEAPIIIPSDPSSVTAVPTDEPVVIGSPEPTPEPSYTPAPTDTPEPTDTPAPTVDPAFPYFLYLEKGSFTLTIYGIGEDGQYSVIVGQYRVSHGGNRTPVGEFVLGNLRQQWHPFANGDHGYAQYAVLYNTASNPNGYSGLFIHGPMYGSENPRNMWPKYYDGEKYIGGENTQGCIRMVVEAAKFIYDNCPKGTRFLIVNGSPLGTTSPDVPSRNGLRQDPTDPAVNGGGN